MSIFTRTTKNLILRIDEFIDNVELGLLVFREGIKSYLGNDEAALGNHIQKIDSLENNADKLQRSIENEMITHSILPQHRAEVILLINELDEIIDAIKHILNEIVTEKPEIPVSLHRQFINITEASVSAGEAIIPAARIFFTSPHHVREKLLKVYYFESETDKLALSTRKTIFQDMDELDLARKAQLRFIIQHIESISDQAQKAADLLSGMAVKIML